MADIVLKDNKGVEHVYEGVNALSVPTVGGAEPLTFSATPPPLVL